MKEYLFSIIGLGAALDALGLICNEKYKKITKSVLSILLIAAVAIPLPGLIRDLGDSLRFDAYEGEVGSDEFCKTAFEDGMREYIAERFSLRRDEVGVEAVAFSPSDMRAEKIIVTLTGAAALADNKKIRKVINDLNLGVAEVKIEI